MSFYMCEFTATEAQYRKYNGKVCIFLQWFPNNNEPYDERYTIITPLEAEDYRFLFEYTPLASNDCTGNRIRFRHYSLGQPLIFDTTNMIKFTERRPIKPPASRWDKYGERKVYKYGNGRWYLDGYEKREDIEPQQDNLFN